MALNKNIVAGLLAVTSAFAAQASTAGRSTMSMEYQCLNSLLITVCEVVDYTHSHPCRGGCNTVHAHAGQSFNFRTQDNCLYEVSGGNVVSTVSGTASVRMGPDAVHSGAMLNDSWCEAFEN